MVSSRHSSLSSARQCPFLIEGANNCVGIDPRLTLELFLSIHMFVKVSIRRAKAQKLQK